MACTSRNLFALLVMNAMCISWAVSSDMVVISLLVVVVVVVVVVVMMMMA